MSGDVIFDQGALEELFRSEPIAADLQRRALDVEASAKDLVPVDTGRLRASITTQLGQDSESLFADVGSDVEYAAPVEFGTTRVRAQPYLRPALDAARD